ncbi:MAG TPA: DUF4908 domain-containing protein [Caulobacteraceae bacterium]|jgi:hypothetical protein
MFEGKLATLGGLVAAAVLGVSAPACAQPLFRNFSACGGESRGAANPSVARYVASVGGRSFTFDRSAAAPDALLKFDDDSEVWVLEASPAPGGGKIYRNDAGDRVLQVTCLGGLTLYVNKPEGDPVAILGDAEELLPPPVTAPDAMLLRAVQAAARAGRASQHQITFTTSQMPPQATPIFLESFSIAADAIVKLSRQKQAKPFLAKLDTVQFLIGPRPDVSLNGSTMIVTLTPAKGFAGRPSSNRIMKTCLKR